ncbi:hypothetical protein [Aquimarina algiphila]|uniref:hypothetical protein n=1 Tax=Aquimarina algiphila TaxID=2047982 RepID=UPI00232B7D86|nr:hypothetical protein [Aquimarina algiphila]
MINESKTINSQNLNTLYVFTKDNQVYLKKNISFESSENSTPNEEWFPINFQWSI